MPVRKWVSLVKPDVLLEDGDKPEVPGWDLQAIWTPGHSPGHLCFWEPRNRLMLTGDHVLPRITPNIGLHPQSGDDPLGDFLRSLDKLAPYDSDEVLPAHEHRFVGLPARLAELAEHHEHRFDEVLESDPGRPRHRLGGGRLHEVVPLVGPHRGLHAPDGRGRGDGPHPGPGTPRRPPGHPW